MLLRAKCIDGTGPSKTASADGEHNDGGSGIYQPIDDRRYLFEAAERIPAAIEAALDCSQEAMALCDVKGKIMAVNEPFCTLLQEDKGHILGAYHFNLFQKLRPFTESGRTPGRRQYALSRALKTGRHVRGVMMRIGSSPGSWRTIESAAMPLFNPGHDIIGAVAVFRDITALRAFREIGTLSIKAKNVDDLLEESLDCIMNAFGLRTAWYYSYDTSCGELRLKAIKGEHTGVPAMPAIENPDIACHGIVSRAFNKNKPELYKDYRRSTLVHAFDPLSRRRSIGSMTCIPLYAGGTGIGVLVASTGIDRHIDEGMLTGLTKLANQLAMGFERITRESGLIKDREQAEAHLEALSEDIGRIVYGSIDSLEKAVKLEIVDDIKAPVARSLTALHEILPLIDSVKKQRSMPSINPVRQTMDIAVVLSACAASIVKAGGKRVSITCDGIGGEVYASPLLKDMLIFIFDSSIKGTGNEVDIRAGIDSQYVDGYKHIRLSVEYCGHSADLAIATLLAGKYGIRLWMESEKEKDRIVILLPAA